LFTNLVEAAFSEARGVTLADLHYAVARGKHQRLQLGVHPVLQDDVGHEVALGPEVAPLDYRSVTWAVGVYELFGSP
jgi:hypothetical protein